MRNNIFEDIEHKKDEVATKSPTKVLPPPKKDICIWIWLTMLTAMLLAILIFLVVHFLPTKEPIKEIEEPEPLKFLISTRNKICQFDDKTLPMNCTTEGLDITDLDYHAGIQSPIWSEGSEISIKHKAIKPNRKDYLEKNLDHLEIAVDFINDKIYYFSKREAGIYVRELSNPRHRTNIIHTSVINPEDIAVNPYDGLVFISEDARIYRANMDGSNLSPLIEVSKDAWKNYRWGKLAVDCFSKHVYAVFTNTNQIVRYKYNGDRTWSHVSENTEEVTGLDFFRGHVYWINNATKKIFQIDLKYGHIRTLPTNLTTPISNLKLIHSDIQKPHINPCHENDCEQMCLLTSESTRAYRCACYFGWQLHADERKCIPIKDFFLYMENNAIKRRDLQGKSLDNIKTESDSIEGRVRGVVFNFRDKIVYYFYAQYAVKDNMNGGTPRYVQVKELSTGEIRVAFDFISENLFLIDISGKELIALRWTYNDEVLLVTHTVRVGLEDLDSIAVEPIKGHIFYSQHTPGRITRVDYDGSNEIKFSKLSITRASSLMIDYASNKLWWMDVDNLQYSNFDGTNVRTFMTGAIDIAPTSLFTRYNNRCYVYDKATRGVWELQREHKKLLFNVKYGITQLTVFTESVQPELSESQKKKHPCWINNGGCRSFCYASANSTGNYRKTCINVH